MGWQKGVCVGVMLLFVVGPCSGLELNEFCEYLNGSRTVDSIHEIDYDNQSYEPNKTVRTSGHIAGWIDIVGYEGSVMIGNITYINNSKEPKPIYDYNVWDVGITSPDYITNNAVDYIKVVDERISVDDNITTVEIDIHLKWHHSTLKSRKVCTPVGCWTYKWIDRDYYHEYTTFSAVESTPQQYPVAEVLNVDVMRYNISISPKTIVYLNDNEFIIGYRVECLNESVEYYFDTLAVSENSKGFPICNQMNKVSQSIYEDSDVFSRAGSKIYINSTDVDDLQIFALTPYTEHEVGYNISNYSEQKIIKKAQLSNIFLIFVFGWAIVKLGKRFVRF